MVVRAAARVVGRRLLNHCFTVTGGEDHHLATGAAKSSGGSTTGDGAANATATPGGVGADLWAPAGVESGVHADRYSVRLLYWLVHTLAALGLLILIADVVAPSRSRVSAEKARSARRAMVPGGAHAGLRGDRLARGQANAIHAVLPRAPRGAIAVDVGDMKFITFRARLTHFAASIICTASLSMGLTDLDSAKVTGGFWTHQIWVFGALFLYEIVLGIALRLAAIGASERAVAAPDTVATRR
eukprot:CAMPEP_0181374386 /NCGR_PEP_ID=MMETSP1106-20121128/15986_1 /TAXON_ID=81844 /ORGANISM="Mantoniella antarctica, Strain SL-175" /LENGTH=242 /DNA_ID=CAMNT_0023492351 /DNA_START=125 /DNA_END=849 /DNA_ORIENTATION=-